MNCVFYLKNIFLIKLLVSALFLKTGRFNLFFTVLMTVDVMSVSNSEKIVQTSPTLIIHLLKMQPYLRLMIALVKHIFNVSLEVADVQSKRKSKIHTIFAVT